MKQWSAAALAAAAILSIAACGAPSPEANAKKVVELLTDNKVDEAKKLMTEAEQKRVSSRTGLDVLGNKKMHAGCKTSTGTSADDNGTPVVKVPYDCGDKKFEVVVKLEGNLVDRISYNTI